MADGECPMADGGSGKGGCLFPMDHPVFEGHFPGTPVAPGALLLAETLKAIEAGIGAAPGAWRIESAKFLVPVRPGDRIAIEYSRAAGGAIRFSCSVDGRIALRGVAACPATAAPG